MALRSAGARWGFERRENDEEVGHDAPRPRGLLGHALEVAAELGDALPRDAVVLEDPPHEGGEVEDARERVVDLVGDAGRELAERGQAIGLEQLPLRLLELGRALRDLGLELLGGLVDLGEGLAQALPHEVERAGEAPQLAAGGDLDRVLEVHAPEGGVGLDEAVDGTRHEEADEHDDEDGDEHRLDDRGDDHPAPGLADEPVRRPEVEGDVEHPQDVLARGVGVAGGGAAGGLVVDRRDHREPPTAVRGGEDAGAGGRLHPDEGLGARVAEDARLRVLVHEPPRLGGGREHDAPLLVEDADAADALLPGDDLHRVVGGLAVVGEHGVPRGGGEAARELVGAHDHRLVVAALDRVEADDPGHDRDQHHEGHEGHDQLLAQRPGRRRHRRSGASARAGRTTSVRS